MMIDGTKPFPTNGRWWADRWWVDQAEEYRLPWPPEKLTAAVDTLIPHFDEAWGDALLASGQLPGHPIGLKLMWQRGGSSAALMLQLAQQIRLFGAEPTFASKRAKLLAVNPQDVSSVMFELNIAQMFGDEGAKVSFPRETNKAKAHDIVATFNAETVNIECKNLQEEDWEDWADTLMSKVIVGLPTMHGDTEIAFHVELHPRLSDIVRNVWHKNGTAVAMSDAFAKRIQEEARSQLAANGIPFQTAIPDLCSIACTEKALGYGGVAGMQLSSPTIFRRILSNGFEEAATQLPKDRAGLVAVFSKHVPTYEFAKLVFDTLMDNMTTDYAHVAGMVIFTQQYMFAERRQPYFLLNRRCTHAEGSSLIAEILQRQLKLGGA